MNHIQSYIFILKLIYNNPNITYEKLIRLLYRKKFSLKNIKAYLRNLNQLITIDKATNVVIISNSELYEFIDENLSSTESDPFVMKNFEYTLYNDFIKPHSEIVYSDLLEMYNDKEIYDCFALSKRITEYEKIYVENKNLGYKAVFVGNDSNDKIPNNVDKPSNGIFWDYAYRPSGKNPVHIIVKSDKDNKFLFIMQPRPPLKKVIISFPAGLIESKIDSELLFKDFVKNDYDKQQLSSILNDENKKDVVLLNAIKELKEETGFFPLSIKRMHMLIIPKSAGMTTESAYYCFATVDSLNIGEGKLDKKWDKEKQKYINSEDIKYVWLTIDEYLNLLSNCNGNYLLSELGDFMYMLGYKRIF